MTCENASRPGQPSCNAPATHSFVWPGQDPKKPTKLCERHLTALCKVAIASLLSIETLHAKGADKPTEPGEPAKGDEIPPPAPFVPPLFDDVERDPKKAGPK